MKAIGIQEAKAPAIIFISDFGKNVLQQNRIAISFRDKDIRPVTDRFLQCRDFLTIKVYEVIFTERRDDVKSQHGASIYELSSGSRNMHTSTRKSVYINVVKIHLLLGSQNFGEFFGIAPYDIELNF